MIDKTAIEALSKAEAITNAGLEISDGMELRRGALALPNDFTLHDLEKFLPNRRRQRGEMTTSAIGDFVAYTTKNAEAGATVFIDQENMKACAVLNLGTTDKPGHADNKAMLESRSTAAYSALRNIAKQAAGQSVIAEFMEDWMLNIVCLHEGIEIQTAKAIAAVRSITIDTARKLEVEEKQLGASKSAFESIQASSKETLPTEIRFKCIPYKELQYRTFVMRPSILTTGDRIALSLRIIKIEEHEEQMAAELAEIIRAGIKQDDISVLLGKYVAK